MNAERRHETFLLQLQVSMRPRMIMAKAKEKRECLSIWIYIYSRLCREKKKLKKTKKRKRSLLDEEVPIKKLKFRYLEPFNDVVNVKMKANSNLAEKIE